MCERKSQFSDTAIQTCLTIKILFGLRLGQTKGFVESLLRMVGLVCSRFQHFVPSSENAQRKPRPYRGGTGPLKLLADSTGIKAEGEGEGELTRPRPDLCN